MARTSPVLVKKILEEHYNGKSSLDPFIQTAGSLVDKVSTNDTGSLLSSSDLELIERWLAAHFYWHSDQILRSEADGRASGAYQGRTEMIFLSSHYGQTALALDVTGYLAYLQRQAQEGRKRATAVWGGTRYRHDYSDRSSDQ